MKVRLKPDTTTMRVPDTTTMRKPDTTSMSDWRQFVRLNRGAGHRLLAGVTASPDTDPVPVVIWATVLALTPLLLTAIRSTLRLSITGTAGGAEIFNYVALFRTFYVFYAMLLAILATAAIWDALLPDRADQEVMGVLPVRPLVLAASRLAAATGLMLLLAAAVAVPVALTFGVASGLQKGSGPLLRVVPAHLLTITAAVMSLFFTLVTLRATVVLIGSERVAERLASALQALTLILFVEAFVFLPGVLLAMVRALRDGGTVPWWLAPAFWFTSLYGWIAEGGRRTPDVTRALLAAVVPALTAIATSLGPAGWLARRAQGTLSRDRASLLTHIVRRLVAIWRPDTAVGGMTVFAAATLARSRRHAILLASYTGMAIAMATIELLTAGFMDRFNLSAPRQDVLAVPLVAIFFVVFGLRAALAQPADPLANWIFRIAPPSVVDGRHAARLVVTWLGLVPVLVATGVALLWLWGAGTALQVLALDTAAGLLLTELAFSRWSKVPCGSLHATATESVKSRWPLIVLFLYLFAFRGADLQMFALRRGAAVWALAAIVAAIGCSVRLLERRRVAPGTPAIDVIADGLSGLHLSESDA